MKKWMRTIIGLTVAVILVLAYTHRQVALSGLTSLSSAKKTRLRDSVYATDFKSALATRDSHPWLRTKIAWDLWCIQMSADVSSPKKKDGYIFFIVDATDRTDVRFIYIFDSEGLLLEVASQPLA